MANKTIDYLSNESKELRDDLDEKTQKIKQLEREITLLRSTNYNTLNLMHNHSYSVTEQEDNGEDQSSPFFSNQPSLGQTLKLKNHVAPAQQASSNNTQLTTNQEMDTFRHGYSSNEHLLPHYHLANPRFEDDQQQLS